MNTEAIITGNSLFVVFSLELAIGRVTYYTIYSSRLYVGKHILTVSVDYMR